MSKIIFLLEDKVPKLLPNSSKYSSTSTNPVQKAVQERMEEPVNRFEKLQKIHKKIKKDKAKSKRAPPTALELQEERQKKKEKQAKQKKENKENPREFMSKMEKAYFLIKICSNEVCNLLRRNNMERLSLIIQCLSKNYTILFESFVSYMIPMSQKLVVLEQRAIGGFFNMKKTEKRDDSYYNALLAEMVDQKVKDERDKDDEKLNQWKQENERIKNRYFKGLLDNLLFQDFGDDEEILLREKRKNEWIQDEATKLMRLLKTGKNLEKLFKGVTDPGVILEVNKRVFNNMVDESEERVNQLKDKIAQLEQFSYIRAEAPIEIERLVDDIIYKVKTIRFEHIKRQEPKNSRENFEEAQRMLFSKVDQKCRIIAEKVLKFIQKNMPQKYTKEAQTKMKESDIEYLLLKKMNKGDKYAARMIRNKIKRLESEIYTQGNRIQGLNYEIVTLTDTNESLRGHNKQLDATNRDLKRQLTQQIAITELGLKREGDNLKDAEQLQKRIDFKVDEIKELKDEAINMFNRFKDVTIGLLRLFNLEEIPQRVESDLIRKFSNLAGRLKTMVGEERGLMVDGGLDFEFADYGELDTKQRLGEMKKKRAEEEKKEKDKAAKERVKDLENRIKELERQLRELKKKLKKKKGRRKGGKRGKGRKSKNVDIEEESSIGDSEEGSNVHDISVPSLSKSPSKSRVRSKVKNKAKLRKSPTAILMPSNSFSRSPSKRVMSRADSGVFMRDQSFSRSPLRRAQFKKPKPKKKGSSSRRGDCNDTSGFKGSSDRGVSGYTPGIGICDREGSAKVKNVDIPSLNLRDRSEEDRGSLAGSPHIRTPLIRPQRAGGSGRPGKGSYQKNQISRQNQANVIHEAQELNGAISFRRIEPPKPVMCDKGIQKDEISTLIENIEKAHTEEEEQNIEYRRRISERMASLPLSQNHYNGFLQILQYLTLNFSQAQRASPRHRSDSQKSQRSQGSNSSAYYQLRVNDNELLLTDLKPVIKYKEKIVNHIKEVEKIKYIKQEVRTAPKRKKPLKKLLEDFYPSDSPEAKPELYTEVEIADAGTQTTGDDFNMLYEVNQLKSKKSKNWPENGGRPYRMYPLSKLELDFIKNTRKFENLIEIMQATENGQNLPDMVQHPFYSVKNAFNRSGKGKNRFTRSFKKVGNLGDNELLRAGNGARSAKKRLFSLSGHLSDEVPTIPKYEKKMLARYIENSIGYTQTARRGSRAGFQSRNKDSGSKFTLPYRTKIDSYMVEEGDNGALESGRKVGMGERGYKTAQNFRSFQKRGRGFGPNGTTVFGSVGIDKKPEQGKEGADEAGGVDKSSLGLNLGNFRIFFFFNFLKFSPFLGFFIGLFDFILMADRSFESFLRFFAQFFQILKFRFLTILGDRRHQRRAVGSTGNLFRLKSATIEERNYSNASKTKKDWKSEKTRHMLENKLARLAESGTVDNEINLMIPSVHKNQNFLKELFLITQKNKRKKLPKHRKDRRGADRGQWNSLGGIGSDSSRRLSQRDIVLGLNSFQDLEKRVKKFVQKHQFGNSEVHLRAFYEDIGVI